MRKFLTVSGKGICRLLQIQGGLYVFLFGRTFTLRQTQRCKCDVPLFAAGFLVGAEISKKTLSMPWWEGREREKYE